jgi:hypothetical protein
MRLNLLFTIFNKFFNKLSHFSQNFSNFSLNAIRVREKAKQLQVEKMILGESL